MSKHIGHDHAQGYRFRIVGIDAANQTVAIQYETTAWLAGRELIEQLSCADFVEQLVSGRFEIRPAG